MGYFSWKMYARVLMGFMVISTISLSHGYTDSGDVFAINSLYASLGYPPLPGWIPNGGDPCLEAWQGVECVNSNITAIILNGANLGGELGVDLEYFSSIITINLSENHIGGGIPINLPVTLRILLLSANQFVGSIPSSLSALGQLTDMDLSSNNLSGQLPPSFGNLSALTSLHLQNNQISGTLDALQDLPLLTELNIANNLFSGPIPEKLLRIPIFIKDGNPFNATITPSPSILPLPPFPSAEPPFIAHGGPTYGPSGPDSGKKTTRKVIWIGVALFLVVVAVGLTIFMLCCCKQKKESEEISNWPKAYRDAKEKHKDYFFGSNNETETVVRSIGAVSKQNNEQETDSNKTETLTRRTEEHEIDMDLVPPPFVEKLHVQPNVQEITSRPPVVKTLNPPVSVRSFTISSLQQYTNSFSQENFVGQGMIGSVYRAELPDGKVLAVKKLDNVISEVQSDNQFLELVSSVYKLQHSNVVELVGYCGEHGQRLLIYDYCSNGTLYDALHSDDESNKRLSWNARIRISLGAAKALEYLHEVCQPPVVHHNFKSANVLLDDEDTVRVSDCGLAPLVSSGSVSQLPEQLSDYGYSAPEFEMGSYTYQSDIFSFGVVMLELLTGRKSYDRSRPRGEQFLVRWAIPQLHDFDALWRMVDPSLNGDFPAKSLSHFADIISLCVQSEPEFRPPMSEIVENLVNMIQREPLNYS